MTAIQGLSNRTTGRALMPDDPVRIASISKLFVALGVLRLVEAGTLDLDADVNRWLEWDLRHPGFPDTPVTLRSLLSHQSGLRDGINYALPMDATLPDALREPAAWDVDHPPGAYFTYANLNWPVIAAVMEAATGERFDAILRNQVFAPLDLEACFNWTGCAADAPVRAVTLYRPSGEVARDDLRGTAKECPTVPASDGNCDLARYRLGWTGSVFSPQGGLRIGARDLARVGQMFLRGGEGFLSPASIAEMTRAQWAFDGRNGADEAGYFCAYGLGVHVLALPGRPAACDDDPFDDGQVLYGHSGDAYSLRSGLWWSPAAGDGVAFYHSENAEDAPVDLCIFPCE